MAGRLHSHLESSEEVERVLSSREQILFLREEQLMPDRVDIFSSASESSESNIKFERVRERGTLIEK